MEPNNAPAVNPNATRAASALNAANATDAALALAQLAAAPPKSGFLTSEFALLGATIAGILALVFADRLPALPGAIIAALLPQLFAWLRTSVKCDHRDALINVAESLLDHAATLAQEIRRSGSIVGETLLRAEPCAPHPIINGKLDRIISTLAAILEPDPEDEPAATPAGTPAAEQSPLTTREWPHDETGSAPAPAPDAASHQSPVTSHAAGFITPGLLIVGAGVAALVVAVLSLLTGCETMRAVQASPFTQAVEKAGEQAAIDFVAGSLAGETAPASH